MAVNRDRKPTSRSKGSPLRRPRSLAFRKLRSGLPPTVAHRKVAAGTAATPVVAPERPNRTTTGKARTAIAAAVAPPAPAPALPPPRPILALPAPAPNAFELRGDYWEISYDGHTALVADCRGLRYLAILVRDAAAPRGPIHARELVALATGNDAGPIELEGRDYVLDARARTLLMDRLQELAAERERACATGDLERAAAIDEEHERVGETLMAAGSRGSRGRRGAFADTGEKARKAVSKASHPHVQGRG